MAYLLDTNVFIAAKRTYYGLDFCPGFWDWLVRENAKGAVYSIANVEDELVGQGDDLSNWAAKRGPAFFRPLEPSVLAALATVTSWVNGGRYDPGAVSTFLQEADFFLVGQALATGDTLVTHEKAENSRHRVKIPDVCIGLGVKHMQTFTMLRKERARFVLEPKV